MGSLAEAAKDFRDALIISDISEYSMAHIKTQRALDSLVNSASRSRGAWLPAYNLGTLLLQQVRRGVIEH